MLAATGWLDMETGTQASVTATVPLISLYIYVPIL
jgi:hypothetical protein